MQCPVCKKPLIVVERKGIELDYCLSCEGFWFDDGEIEFLSQAYNMTLSLPDLTCMNIPLTKEAKRHCPRCLKKMQKICLDEQTNLIIDRCPSGDGLWFDAGELSLTIKKYATANGEQPDQFITFLGEVFCPN